MQSALCRRRFVFRLTPLRVRFASTSTEAAVREREPADPEIKPFSAIPGPRPLPVLRNLLEMRRNMARFHFYIEECHKKYGEIFKLEAPG